MAVLIYFDLVVYLLVFLRVQSSLNTNGKQLIRRDEKPMIAGKTEAQNGLSPK